MKLGSILSQMKQKEAKMIKLVIIGGGELKDLETLKFDKRIVELTGKKNPKALFIPTASGESEGYCKTFQKIYGKKLGCKTEILYLLKDKPTKKELREKILSADLVYVGGGNTLSMMKRWRLLGVDKMLKEAYNKGIVLSGLSAGGICWFEYGHSDSMSFYNPKSWKYIKVKGIGLVKGIHCPHFDGQTGGVKRKKDFKAFMKKYSNMGITIDNSCAIEFIDGKYKVLSAKKVANAYKVYRKRGKVVVEEIPKDKGYRPVKELYERS